MRVKSRVVFRTGLIDVIGMLPGVRTFREGPRERLKPPTRAQSEAWRAKHAAEVKPEQVRTTGNVLVW